MKKVNKFKKYCPNVWVAECDDEYEKGDIIELETKYGKDVECEVYNLIAEKDGKYYYSIVRTYPTSHTLKRRQKNTKRKIVVIYVSKSNQYEASNEGREFLSLGEPIKVGHHSEKATQGVIRPKLESHGEKCRDGKQGRGSGKESRILGK